MDIINPANGKVISQVTADTAASVSEKFAKVAAAQTEWRQVPQSDKIATLNTFAELTAKHSDRLAKDMSAEVGKPIHQAKGEIEANIARIKFFIDHVESATATEVVVNEQGLREEISYEPLGVVTNISAWNFPFFVSTNVVVPALLTGNSVLFKPSEFATKTGQNMVDLLYEAGIPSEVLQIVIGDGKVGAELLKQNINGLFFTGSYATGAKIAAAVAGRMLRLQLELGGKDPSYICEDNDPAKVAPMVGDGCFYNAGQSCCAVERLYVHEKIYDSFVQELKKFADSLVVGEPEDTATYLGPLTRKAQIAVLEDQIADAKAKGGEVVAGGKSCGVGSAWFQPTVVANANHSMKLMTEESFGPVIGVQKVSSDAEAIKLMNDTEYGLTSSIYTSDEQKARNILTQLNSGTVYWNCCDRVSPFLPWSGRKHSGVGSTLSKIGIQAFVQPKAWHLKNQ